MTVLFSCDREEYLNILPKSKIIPTQVNDYRLLLDQIEAIGISPGFTGSHGNQEFMSDDFRIPDELFNRLGQEEKNSFTWQDNIYQVNDEDGDWQTFYGQIYAANIVIEEIMDATDGTMEEKLQLEAEAKLHRAYAYFSLANLYAVHYDANTPNAILAVPLRLDTRLSGVDFSRVTLKDLYDLVLEDVTSSIESLPETTTYNHRPSKAAAHAFLARIYLYIGDFEKSRNAANSSLGLVSTLLDYNNVPDWFFPGVAELPEIEEDPQIIWLKSAFPFALLPISEAAQALVEPNDQRRRLFASIRSFFGVNIPGNVYAAGYARNARPAGFSTPEMYLIRAECNARLENAQAAIDDLNILRIKRFDTGTFVPLTSTSPTEALALVKKERRIELIAQNHRFFDLKRYNTYDASKIDLVHTLLDQTFTLQANSKNWAVPIAQKYIIETPEIGQNDRE